MCIPSTNTDATVAVPVMSTFQDPAYTDTQPPYALAPVEMMESEKKEDELNVDDDDAVQLVNVLLEMV